MPRVMGDEVVVSATSKELVGFGWKGGLKNTPSAYLVGLIIGYKALLKGVKRAILDIGFIGRPRVPASSLFLRAHLMQVLRCLMVRRYSLMRIG